MKDSIDVNSGDVNDTIASLKRLSDEMRWMLEFLENKTDSINVKIVRENEAGHRITLTIDKPDRGDTDVKKSKTNTATGV